MTTLHDPSLHSFASDNYSGVHPEVMQAIAEANLGHVGSYGADPYTARFQELVVQHFGEGSTVHPVLTGTGSNVGSLQALVPRWGAVICAATAHIYTDEGGAPERLGGLKLLSVPTPDGKLTPELIDRQAYGWGDQQRPQPLAVSITQTTELGTAYSTQEIRAITQHAHSLGMKVHLDGARIANAAATTGASSASSPATPASTSSRSAERRTGSFSASRSSSSPRTNCPASPTSARWTPSSRRRCASSRRSSSRCSRATSGCARRRTRTRWRRASPVPCRSCPG
ncbi:hypothetical protein GCM10025867_04340 [Frondihabitans sucicola]|uniref:Aromatic amino acid beta-eliminating lyase/threonine aldolase domain-containing protein n=1 Tax=Frondihabitans sucicola TaxID=1268041 RepID=A0ABN6XTD9_9MICO|nr:hypothetical protein GCM10025867_04340 [Frondihabitans sucicola]